MDLPYHNNKLSNYLLNFYPPQGRIELKYLQNMHYSLCECENCSGIFQKFIPNDFLMEKLYEDWISPGKALTAFKQKQSNSNIIQEYKNEVNLIKEAFFQEIKEVKALDYGMGWGAYALTAKNMGWEVYGTELSKTRINYAKKQGIQFVHINEAPLKKFDFINTEQVFEHLPEPLITLTTIKQWLKKDGIIKISVPTANNIEERLKKMDWAAPKNSNTSVNPVAPLEHINFFKRGSILEMARIAGLEEIKLPVMVQYKNMNWDGNLKKKNKTSASTFEIKLF